MFHSLLSIFLKSVSSPEEFWKIQNLFFAFLLQRKDALGSRLSWSLPIYFFVTLHSRVCKCPKISQNVFSKKVFLELILQSICFICITWKRKQTMDQQPPSECEWTKSNKKTTATKKSHHTQIEHEFYCSI